MLARLLVAASLAVAMAGPSHARVTAQNASGFSSSHEADLKVTPGQAFDAFSQIGAWWDMAHSYSGQSKKMSLDVKPGGRWLEKLPGGGFVTHMIVTQADPGERLVLTGGLGPLGFMGVSAVMSVNFKKTEQGTHVTLSYAVGGFDPGEFKALAQGVDGVLNAQFTRYQNYTSTGKP